MLSCHRASLCPSYSAGKIHCVVLLFSSSWSGLWVLPVALECCPCWGGELGARAAATQLLCGSAAGKWFWCLSTWNLTVLWGEVSWLAPLDAYPSLPLLSPPNWYSLAVIWGEMLWGLEQPGEENRGENMGQFSLAELQLCHPAMETALITRGMTSLPPTLLQDSPGQRACSGAKGLAWDRAELVALFGEVGKL